MNYLVVTLVFAIVCNMVLFLIAYGFKTDKLTDVSYALTFIALAVYGLCSEPRAGVGRFVIAAMVITWAVRLGSFLLMRIWRTGRDSRFDAIRGDFWKFGRFWLAQGVSVWLIMLAALQGFHQSAPTLRASMYLGVAMWLCGLCLEATADLQKYRFAQDPHNKGTWIASGVWNYSRHPNYFGEMLVWLGMYMFVVPILSGTALLVGAVSPVYIICLLVFVSGLPPLEKSADARWGNDPAYQAYKRRTSILVPWPHH